MKFTRREWLGLASAAAGAATIADPLWAQRGSFSAGETGALAIVVERLRAFAVADLADKGFPGMTVALLGPGGASASFAAGLADLDRRTSATPDHLFQIGSITKSLTAMALFVLADQGKLDLDATVQQLLPDHRLPPEPIRLVHLLDHSSGLPNALADPGLLSLPADRLWTGFAPGSRYSYCNLGYGLLGAVLERASGMAWPLALDMLVLKPLGMSRAVPVIRTADRAAYATGHVRLRSDLPWLPKARLAAANWFDFHHAAGSVGATAADMVRYLQFLGALARGTGAPLFSDALAERFRTPTIASTPPGARYGNGLHTLDVEGGACFRHTGGVPGFSSAFTLDRASGVGCYASVNVGGAGNYRPVEITEYAVALLREAGAGRPLPAPRQPRSQPAVKDAARYTGRWLSADGGALTIAERGGALFVASGGSERQLRAGGENGFVTDHPALDPHMLVFEGDAEPVLRLGDRLFARGSAPAVPPLGARLAALAGTYYSSASWSPRQRVFAIGDRLFGGSEELVEASDGSWRSKAPNLASERIWFERPVGGRPQVLNVSGTPYARLSDRSL